MCVCVCVCVCVCACVCIYIYIYIYASFNKFPTFFILPFKIVVDSLKLSMLLLYILWEGRSIFRISDLNKQLQQELEYTLLKPDYHSWWISKMQSGRKDTSKKRYAIKLCFKLGKQATEMYGMLQTAFRPSCMNRASMFEIQVRQGVREGWWDVWEELGRQYTKVDWPKG